MKILVTGGTGLVGTGLKRVSNQFTQHDIILTGSGDCDLLSLDNTVRLIDNHAPDHVIHLAANVGGLFKNMNHKVRMFEDNMLMNMNILKACHTCNINRFTGVLSTCIFPDKTTYPINEELLHMGPPHHSNDAYAYAKRMLKVQCDAYNEQHATRYTCVVPTNIYGHNDNYSLQDAHVIPALIHKCYISKNQNAPFVVAGTGTPLRQFIHADDLANLMLKLIDIDNDQCVIIAPEREISIGYVATCIARCFDYEHGIKFDRSLSDGQHKKTADNTRLKSLLPGYHFIDFEDGIKDVVNHFIENYEFIRK